MSANNPRIPAFIPRLNLKQRVALTSLESGFLVYQTDKIKGFYYFENSEWLYLGNGQPAGSVRPSNPYIGQTFFDTTLGYRIDWNGSNWVNSTGAIV
jgi:hypothetical protein